MRAAMRVRVNPKCLREGLNLPYEMTGAEVALAMQQVYDALWSIDCALLRAEAARIENRISPIDFGALLSKLIVGGLSRHCKGLIKNRYHNGHPDLLPVGVYKDDSAQYTDQGVEVKCSKYDAGWQGHNAEASWMLIGVYVADTKAEDPREAMPTYLKRVMIAKLEKTDWSFAGRGEGSRRTPTASILASGVAKLRAGTIYQELDVPSLDPL